jgi:hypothetical protein
MSNSTKKTAVFTDKAHRSDKRAANKQIRKFIKSSEQGFKSIGFLHKLFNSWNIRDWKFFPSSEEDKQKALRK